MDIFVLGILGIMDFVSSIAESYSKHKTAYWLALFFVFAIGGTLFFHNRLLRILPPTDSINVWAVALDIILAHTVITIPIVLCSYYILSIFLSLEFRLTNNFVNFLVDKAGAVSCEIPIIGICIYLLLMGFTTYFVFQADLLLLTGRPDLQMYIFGNFDPSLGFAYPTVFRLTTLINHFEILQKNLQANSTLSTILSFIGVMITAILSLVGVFKTLEYISDKAKGR